MSGSVISPGDATPPADARSAREMSHRSMAAVEARDRKKWLALFADDGYVEDPVGPSMFDPEGRGHHGKEAIGAFFDMVTALYEEISFDIRGSYQCGAEVANVGTINITLGNGQVGKVDAVAVYRVTPEGKIASLRAFWEPDAIRFDTA